MKVKHDRAELLADKLELPADALGSVKLSLFGRSRLLAENHRGIVSYTDAAVVLDCGASKLNVRGDSLRIKAMSGKNILICGRIVALEFE